METFVEIVIGIVAIVSLVAFFLVYISKRVWTTPLRLTLKSIISGLALALSCTSVLILSRTQSTTMIVIFGVGGFIFGTYVIFSQRIRYELYDKRILPYVIKKSQNKVDKLRVPLDTMNKQFDESRVTSEKLGGRTRPYSLLTTMTFMALFLGIVWAIPGGLTGGFEGLLSAALLGGILGAFLGPIVWVAGWIFRKNEEHNKQD